MNSRVPPKVPPLHLHLHLHLHLITLKPFRGQNLRFVHGMLLPTRNAPPCVEKIQKPENQYRLAEPPLLTASARYRVVAASKFLWVRAKRLKAVVLVFDTQASGGSEKLTQRWFKGDLDVAG